MYTGNPAVALILDVRGIDGGLDLVAADRERESAVYSGSQATLYARLAAQSSPSRRPQRAAEMDGFLLSRGPARATRLRRERTPLCDRGQIAGANVLSDRRRSRRGGTKLGPAGSSTSPGSSAGAAVFSPEILKPVFLSKCPALCRGTLARRFDCASVEAGFII